MGYLLVVRVELLVQCPGFLAADCCMIADIDRVGVCVCKLPVPDMFLAQCYYDARGETISILEFCMSQQILPLT